MMSSLALNQSFAPQPTTGTNVCLTFFLSSVTASHNCRYSQTIAYYLLYHFFDATLVLFNQSIPMPQPRSSKCRTKTFWEDQRAGGIKEIALFCGFCLLGLEDQDRFQSTNALTVHLFFREEGGRMAGRAGQAISRTSAGILNITSNCFLCLASVWSSSLLSSSGLGAPHLFGDSQEPSLELSSLESNAIR